MRFLASIVKLVRHVKEWHEREHPEPVLDHGTLTDESFAYWMKRVEREERNGTRRLDV